MLNFYYNIHLTNAISKRIVFVQNNVICGIAGYAIIDSKIHDSIGSYEYVRLNNNGVLYRVGDKIQLDNFVSINDFEIIEIYFNQKHIDIDTLIRIYNNIENNLKVQNDKL